LIKLLKRISVSLFFFKYHDDSILKECGWISVNDSLPSTNRNVIVLTDSGDSFSCQYNGNVRGWEKCGFELEYNILYWREL